MSRYYSVLVITVVLYTVQIYTHMPWIRLCRLMVHSFVITSLVTVFLFSRRRGGAMFCNIIQINYEGNFGILISI